jgi:glycosyltransferase involved in cell wall biosynthesis
MRAANLAALEAQTCQDYEHILIVDNEGRGLEWANSSLQDAAPAGEYVLILDDDDLLTDKEAIEKLRTAAEPEPDLIIFKAYHGPLGILPSARVWGNRPYGGHIGSCDFITRRDVWLEHIPAFAQPESGDYYFLQSIWLDDPCVVWLDETLAAVQRISKGKAE